jgi:hypothetical protein
LAISEIETASVWLAVFFLQCFGLARIIMLTRKLGINVKVNQANACTDLRIADLLNL